MKIKPLLFTAALAIAALVTGCSQIDKSLYNVAPPRVIGTNIVQTTNAVAIPAFTDAAGVLHPASTNLIVLPVATPIYAAPELVAKPAIESGINLVKTLPVPFAGVAGTLLYGLYSIYASVRNKKALVAVVKGIDAGREFLNETPEGRALDTKIKDLLIQHQEAAGVLKAVSNIVNDHTGNTVP